MTRDEARKLMRSAEASFTDRVIAVGVIAESADASWDDLLECLSVGGYGAELAGAALHRRTKRPLSQAGRFVTDADDWRRFLDRMVPRWSAPQSE
jgi:hypothetical protein